MCSWLVLVLHSPLHQILLHSVQWSCCLQTLTLFSLQFGSQAVRTELSLHLLHPSQGQE
ncbi:hypothetical protein LDENG_00278090 [Lucifuga dentata]|nr:hypothetical protein LDENG_00278090 [Lucifuga dentata]